MKHPTEDEKKEITNLAESLRGMKSPYDRNEVYGKINNILEPYLTEALTKRMNEEFKNFAPVSNIE